MNVLDLPSISDDDELDYELTESVDLAVGNQREKQERAEKFPSGRGEDEAGQQQQPGTTASILSRERKRKQADSLRNSDASDDDGVEVIQHIHREEADQDQDGEKEDDTRQEEVEEEELIKIQGRLAGRVKRIHKVATKRQRKNSKRNLITYDAGGDEEEVAAVDELPEDEEEENFNAERFAQILDGKGDGGTRNLKDQELEDLYASLDVDPDEQLHRFHSLYVTGAVEQMTAFDISRIFAQFEPQNVRPLELSKAFVLTFKNALIAAQLLLDMSKPLRRVRHPKKPEEGELVESSEEDEEEGQVKEEGGEDVAIVKESKAGKRLRRADSDVVEVDVEEVKVPPGKWRVIVSHVPDNKLIYARFATGFELRRSLFIARELERRNNNEVFKCKNAKVRPGLNVFDEKGNELDWDYEHDTRFFDDPTADGQGPSAATATDGDANEGQSQQQSASAEAAQSERPPAQEMETEIAGVKIRSRGRGAKKFMQAFQDSDED